MAEHIKIGDIVPRIQYTADGSTTTFDFPFPIFDDADLDVHIDTTRIEDGFSVSGAGDSFGGTVAFDQPPPFGTIVTLGRSLSIARTTDFQPSGEFRAKVLNDELDYQVAALQGIATEVARAIRLSPTDDDQSNLTLPKRIERAQKLLGFDADGNVIAADGPAGGGGSLKVEDEGSTVATGVTAINFVGSGVAAVDAGGGEVTVTVAGGAAPVGSVFGRTGAVIASANDYTWAQIDKTASTLADLATRSHNDLTQNGVLTHAQLDAHVATAGAHIDHGTVNLSAGAGLSGGGDITASRSFAVNINGLSVDSNPDGSADYVMTHDADAGTLKKVLLNDLPGGTIAIEDEGQEEIPAASRLNFVGAGVFINDAGGGEATVTIPGLAVEDEGSQIATGVTAINFVGSGVTATNAGGGEVMVTVAGGGAPVDSVFGRSGTVTAQTNDYTWAQINKTTSSIADIAIRGHGLLTDVGTNTHAQIDTHIADSDKHVGHSGVVMTAGAGLSGGGSIAASRSFAVDINGLTADAAPDGAADYVMTYDASAAGLKKVLLNNLPGGGGGGTIAIEDEGMEEISAASRLNFVGAGVSVADAGAGEATITIPCPASLASVVDLDAFGVTGDGSDETTKWQNAINATTDGQVHLVLVPPGTHNINNTLLTLGTRTMVWFGLGNVTYTNTKPQGQILGYSVGDDRWLFGNEGWAVIAQSKDQQGAKKPIFLVQNTHNNTSSGLDDYTFQVQTTLDAGAFVDDNHVAARVGLTDRATATGNGLWGLNVYITRDVANPARGLGALTAVAQDWIDQPRSAGGSLVAAEFGVTARNTCDGDARHAIIIRLKAHDLAASKIEGLYDCEIANGIDITPGIGSFNNAKVLVRDGIKIYHENNAGKIDNAIRVIGTDGGVGEDMEKALYATGAFSSNPVYVKSTAKNETVLGSEVNSAGAKPSEIQLIGHSSTGADVAYGTIGSLITQNTNGDEYGGIILEGMQAGSSFELLRATSKTDKTVTWDWRSESNTDEADIIDFTFKGRDSLGNANNYGSMRCAIQNPANGSEEGRFEFWVTNGGALAKRLEVATDGVVVGSPTGGARGAGSLNATGLYVNGAAVQIYDPDILKADTADVLQAGFAATPYNAGTQSGSSTFTPDPANGNFQYAINGGPHTLAPPINNCTLVIQYTNNTTAGAITTSGFTKVTGDSLTTTDGNDFLMYITKLNGFSLLNIVALQ